MQRLRKGAALNFSSLSIDACQKGGRWISQPNKNVTGSWCYPLPSTLVIRQEIPIFFEGNRHRCMKDQIKAAQPLPNDLHLNNLVILEFPLSKPSGCGSMREVSGITARLYMHFSSLFPSLTLFSCSWLYLKDCAPAQAFLHNNSSTLEAAYSSPWASVWGKKQRDEKEQTVELFVPIRTGMESWSHGFCHHWEIVDMINAASGLAASMGTTAFLQPTLTSSLPLWRWTVLCLKNNCHV